ncbi:hypothetical protein D9M73_295620 [compost metagenome]
MPGTGEFRAESFGNPQPRVAAGFVTCRLDGVGARQLFHLAAAERAANPIAATRQNDRRKPRPLGGTGPG